MVLQLLIYRLRMIAHLWDIKNLLLKWKIIWMYYWELNQHLNFSSSKYKHFYSQAKSLTFKFVEVCNVLRRFARGIPLQKHTIQNENNVFWKVILLNCLRIQYRILSDITRFHTIIFVCLILQFLFSISTWYLLLMENVKIKFIFFLNVGSFVRKLVWRRRWYLFFVYSSRKR